MKDPNNKLPIGSIEGLKSYGWEELDDGIRHYVCVLRSQGIETCQSCEGGHGHSYAEPTIEFHGGKGEGPRAVAAAMTFGLPAAELRRVWSIYDGEMVGPLWAITFREKADAWLKRTAEREAAVLNAMGKPSRALASGADEKGGEK